MSNNPQSIVIFYEKPGCATNAKQKQWLREAGVWVIERDLLSYPWKSEELKKFFKGLTPEQCFNQAAPAIKNGEIDPSLLSYDEALTLMTAQPLLIRRPLLVIKNHFLCGFDPQMITALLDLDRVPSQETQLEGCSHPQAPCPTL